MGCTKINVKIIDCKLHLINGSTGITNIYEGISGYTNETISFVDSQGNTTKYRCECITFPAFDTVPNLVTLLNGELEECRCCDGDSTEPTEPIQNKTFEGSCLYRDDTDTSIPEKLRTFVWIDEWLDENKEWYYVPKGASINDPDNLITNIINYKKMPQSQALPLTPNLAALTTPACTTICLVGGASITLADALAKFAVEGWILPDDTARTGLINPSIAVLYPGQKAKDANGDIKKVGTDAVDFNGTEIINAGTPWCPDDQEPIDEDCDSFLKGYDLTKTITNPSATEPAAFRICADLIPLDADDTDSAVQ